MPRRENKINENLVNKIANVLSWTRIKLLSIMAGNDKKVVNALCRLEPFALLVSEARLRASINVEAFKGTKLPSSIATNLFDQS